jgi:hypothetical protein
MAHPSIEGMTVNERLLHFGLVEPFDRAAKSGDLGALIQVLVQAQLSQEQAEYTARTVLANPHRYGY